MDKYYLENNIDLDKEHEDLWSSDYCSLSVSLFKFVLRSNLISEETKVPMLRNWVASNSFLKHQAAVFEMLQCLNLKKFFRYQRETIHEFTAMVSKMIILNDNFILW